MSSGSKHPFFHFVPLFDAILPKEYFSKTTRHWLFSYSGIVILSLIFASILSQLYYVYLWILSATQGVEGLAKSPVVILSNTQSQFAIIFLSIEFILATKITFIERIFGGFDRAYKLHALVGRIAFLLLSLHLATILISLYGSPLDVWLVYLFPGAYLPYTYGMLSFLLFLGLIIVTVWVKIPYNLWLLTHKLMGIPYVLGAVHAWQSQPAYGEFSLFRNVLIAVWLLGAFAYCYKLFFYKFVTKKSVGYLTNARTFNSVTELYIKPIRASLFPKPGQYINIALDYTRNDIKPETHPFSVSGIYQDGIIRVSAKNLGDYTEKLALASTHDIVTVYGPYGLFGEKLYTAENDMIWIAGGIGIAPFLYMSQYMVMRRKKGLSVNRKVQMIWSVKEESELIYNQELLNFAAENPLMEYIPWTSTTKGRLTAAQILQFNAQKYDLKKTLIFICGPAPMMQALTKDFTEAGIPLENLIFEEFSFG